jgi:hypothetical protein
MEVVGWIAYAIVFFNYIKELFQLRQMINEYIPIAPQTMNTLSYTLIALVVLPVYDFHPLHIIWIYLLANIGSPFLNLFPFNIVTPISVILYNIMSIDTEA